MTFDEERSKRTSCDFLLLGVPHGLNPPEKLGKLRQMIDLMLQKVLVLVSIYTAGMTSGDIDKMVEL